MISNFLRSILSEKPDPVSTEDAHVALAALLVQYGWDAPEPDHWCDPTEGGLEWHFGEGEEHQQPVARVDEGHARRK